MIIEKKLDDQLIRSNSKDIPNNIIAAAIFINETGTASHAGIFIKYNNESKIFHYTGRDVLFEPIDKHSLYFHKSLTFLDSILLKSYIAHFELIKENAKPTYGYFYAGSLYTESGNFIAPGGFPEFMTCVGFCINVIQGILMDTQYLLFEDWDDAIIDLSKEYLSTFIERVKAAYPEIEEWMFRKNLRRILPIEYLASAYFDNLPVSKADTDKYQPILENICKNKVNQMK